MSNIALYILIKDLQLFTIYSFQTRYCFWESAIIDDINAASSQTMGEVNSEHEAYERLEESIGYKFRNRFFLLHAFTHGSETPSKLENSYERLEFLGDAILGKIINFFNQTNSFGNYSTN